MTTVPSSHTPVVAPTTAPTTTAERAPRRTRRLTAAALVLVTASAAIVLGAVLGQRLSGTATVTPPAHGTGVVGYPTDWQQYRSGERGDHAVLDEPWRGVGVPGGD
jgi:hypothetical protein